LIEELADPFFVVGDRFDIDQRACEFEYVHNRSSKGEARKGEDAWTASVSSIPIALHPPEKRVTVSRY
jgi:hypothetical protein